MTSIRDERYAAVRAWHRRLAEDFEVFAPGFLDALEVIDGKHPAGPASVKRADDLPPGAPASKPPMTALPPTAEGARQAAARPAPRRRTTRKADG